MIKRRKRCPPPTAEGQTIELERPYVRAAILEANITPLSVTTKGGNKTDGIYIKVKCFNGKVKFKSVMKPEKEWSKPGVKEFKWVFDKVTTPTDNQVVILKGYRYTGFLEDND